MAMLAGKRAVVIGGTRGIGAAISRRLAAEGAAVANVYRDRADEADALRRELAASGSDVVVLRADVADPDALGGALDEAMRRLGGPARDLGPRGIIANLVQPGPIDTERTPADGPNAEANRAPLAIRRRGTADEAAKLVAYLVSPKRILRRVRRTTLTAGGAREGVLA